MNSWWGNSRVAAARLTQERLNKSLYQMMLYGIISHHEAVKMLGYKDIEWDMAVDDALLAVLYA